eukprot:scaffold1066_cov57-Attheya_sp.AAC.3
MSQSLSLLIASMPCDDANTRYDVPIVLKNGRKKKDISGTRLYMGEEKKGDNDGGMKRPILDQLATTLFRLEQDRVEKSSVEDEQGRVGEPMEWSEADSWSNKLSQVMASGPGYAFKQFVADIVAGSDYDEASVRTKVQSFIQEEKVVSLLSPCQGFTGRTGNFVSQHGTGRIARK